MALPTVNFMIYNPTGLDKVKAKWTRELAATLNIDFISIQEHMKKNVGNFFHNQFPGFTNSIVPGVRAPEQDSGRPMGGLAQLMNIKHNIKVSRVATKCFRVQAQILKLQKVSILWINSYSPTDPQTVNFDETELLELFGEVEKIMDSEEYDHVLWNGDINWDPRRHSGFARIVSNFVERVGLKSAWEKFPVSHTHVHTDLKSTSILDHFLMDEALLKVVEGAEAADLGDNLSRHSPCILKLRVGELPARPRVQAEGKKARRPAWYKADEAMKEAFKLDCQARLLKLLPPQCLQCEDSGCQESSHSSDRDGFMLDVMGCMIEASQATIPMSGGGQGASEEKRMPGWKEEVEPRRQSALLWHSVWVSMGRPAVGQARMLMVSTRAKYHYAIRAVKAKEADIKKQQLLEASKLGHMDLLHEMKKIKGNKKSNILPDQVGKAKGENEIVEEFRKVYEELYNSLDDSEALSQLKDEIEERSKKEESTHEVNKITGKAVKEASKRLNSGKGDVTGSYTSDAIKNCPDVFFDLTATVFRSWLTHGTVTLSMLSCAFLPPPKFVTRQTPLYPLFVPQSLMPHWNL